MVGVRIAVRDIAEGQEHKPESQIYNWNIKKDASLDGAQPVKNDSSRDISSDASNYNILNADENVNNLSKEAGLRGGPAFFASNNRDIITTPHISEDNGIRTIGATKSMDDNAFVEGLWDVVENAPKNNVEKSGCK